MSTMNANTMTKEKINWKEIIERTEQTGYNLYDLVPVDFSPLEKLEEIEVIEAELINDDILEGIDKSNPFKDIKNKIKKIHEIKKDLKNDYDINDENLNESLKMLVETFNGAREGYIKNNLDLTVDSLYKLDYDGYEIKEDDDLLTKAALAPKAKVKDLKTVAEKLGFMITPWEYHNKKSFEKEDKKTQKAIKEFAELEDQFDLFVVSPINYWDIKSHISAENPNQETFRSSKIKDVVASVEIQMPVLREFNFRIDDLENNVENLTERMDNSEKSIEKIESTLDDVVTDISNIWTEMAEMKDDIQEVKVVAKNAERKAEQAQSTANAAISTASRAQSMAMKAIDPLLFAVKKGSGLSDTNVAIVGPVWGPDFSWMVPALENLMPQIGQRDLLLEVNPFLI